MSSDTSTEKRLPHGFVAGIRKVSELDITSDDGCPTTTTGEQKGVERDCLRLFEEFAQRSDRDGQEMIGKPVLNRTRTIKYLRRGLVHLSSEYRTLDASRPWIIYWILHSLELLGEVVDDPQKKDIVNFLARCQNPNGGFGGGPGQISHLAPTYASVNALCILGGSDAYEVIDRPNLIRWMKSLKLSDGSFFMHVDGEVDIRGVYCALSVARLVNIYSPELFENTVRWVLSCQTYEGGFGGVPGMEAHGGYTFCGLASLLLLNHGHLCDVDNLLGWAAFRQMRLEGGFQGRTNKLVDSCYSFWQGGIFTLLRILLAEEGHPPHDLLFNCVALQEYLLICCQSSDDIGGMVDKPGKARDYYHTCYALSGLSVAQYSMKGEGGEDEERIHILGPKSNKLKPIHPLYNVGLENAISAAEYFDKLGVDGGCSK